MPRELVPGLWRAEEHLVDYRFERLSDLLVERAAWAETAPSRNIRETVVADAGYIWFRFWILREEAVVEKYFRDDGTALGIYAPVCLPFSDNDYGLSTTDLTLALWLDEEGQLTVLRERQFEAEVAGGLITPEQATAAEERIRKMTLDVGRRLFPPAIIRNFELNRGQLS